MQVMHQHLRNIQRLQMQMRMRICEEPKDTILLLQRDETYSRKGLKQTCRPRERLTSCMSSITRGSVGQQLATHRQRGDVSEVQPWECAKKRKLN